MYDFGIALLGYGNIHITECNILIETINKIDPNIRIYIGTDNANMISGDVYSIIEIKEQEFNYNLKKYVVQAVLKNERVVMFLDSDIDIKTDINFSVINNIENDSLYIINEVYDSHPNNLYINTMRTKSINELGVIREHCFIVSKGWKTNMFFRYWNELDIESRDIQHSTLDGRGDGEGALMWLSAEKSEINKKKNDSLTKKLFDSIIHHREDIAQIDIMVEATQKDKIILTLI